MNYVPLRTQHTLTQPKTHTRNTKIHYNFYLTLVFVPSCTIKPKPETRKTPQHSLTLNIALCLVLCRMK